jgi:hypothetical protein
MKPFTSHKQQRDKSTYFFHTKKSFLLGIISTISASIAATAITDEGANAATAYLFSTPTNYSSFERSLEGTWAGANGTGTITTAVWGQFLINDNNTATSEVGTNGGTSSGTATISFIGDPYGSKQSTGSVSTGCNNANNATNCVYGSTSYSTLSSPGSYDRWYYDSTNNFLYFYSSLGTSSATGSSSGNTDSLQLTLNTSGNQGLYNFDGWNSVSSIKWCSNNTQSSGTGNSGCSNAQTWSFSSANALAFIRVPSPSLLLGLIPFLALVAKRKSGLQLVRKSANAAAKLPV